MASQNAYAKIIAKVWSDPKFKEQLLKNPESVLKQHGIELPQGKKVQVHENTNDVVHLIIPKKPAGDLSETELEAVVAADLPWAELKPANDNH